MRSTRALYPIAVAVTLLCGCVAPAYRTGVAAGEPLAVPSSSELLVAQTRLPEVTRSPRWEARQAVLQGFLGVTLVDELERSGGSSPDVDGSDIDTFPLVGGGAQLKLAGDRVSLGVEGLFAFNWRANAAAVAVEGGGGTLAVDVNLLVLEFYGGPFASLFLGDDWRAYAAAGPLVSFASYDQDGGTISDSGSGFGVGTYARAGIEYRWSTDTMVGLGARVFDSRIDLDSGLGEIEFDGSQVYLTVTRGF